jgi:hypothetical protein
MPSTWFLTEAALPMLDWAPQIDGCNANAAAIITAGGRYMTRCFLRVEGDVYL